jgi:hypothetical protein
MSGTILGLPFSGVVTGDNGSIAAEPGDGSVTNGNARGANAVDWQTARGAATQVASGTNAVICGGSSNTANGTNSGVGAGLANTSSGLGSYAAGGQSNTIGGSYSWGPGGFQASARALHGVGVWASGSIATQGDAQSEEHTLRRQTTDATATRLTADNAVAGAANTINLANFSAIAGRLVVRARAAGGINRSATWFIDVSATRDANAASTLIEGGGGALIVPTHSRGTGSAWRLTVAADTTNGGIAVTGESGGDVITINWVARYSAVQVATAS